MWIIQMKIWSKEEQKEHRKLWIKALRSGNYKQGYYHLKVADRYCCLGVACDVAFSNGFEDDKLAYNDVFEENSYLPYQIVRYFGLATTCGSYYKSSLTLDNDYNYLSFNEIAGIIESEPEGLIENV